MSTVKVDTRNLVYKLCERRQVPLLVTDIIAEHLDHRDLLRINALSRSLNEQANDIIYREIAFHLDSSKQSIQKATLLFRTLLTSKTAARAVRILSLAGDPLQDWRERFERTDNESVEASLRGRIPPGMHADLADFTRQEVELYDKVAASSSVSMHPRISEISVCALILQVLRLASEVEEFSVCSDYFRFVDFRNTLHDMARDSLVRKLRSCSLCLDLMHGDTRHACVVRDWDHVLLMLFAVPGIQRIEAVVNLKPDAVRQLRPGGCSITWLVLNHYQVEDCDINPLLAATSGLKYLEYHATTDHAWLGAPCRDEANPEHGVGFDPLYDALHHVSDSLQELHLSQDFDEDSIHYPGYSPMYEPLFRNREELSSMRQLRTLNIPYAALLGLKRKACVWDWDRILPSSLRCIVLTDRLQENFCADAWTDEDLMPVISSLVKWLSALQPEREPAEFGLHLEHDSSNFNEPRRQEMTRMCEDNGVRCSIYKKFADRPKPTRVRLSRGRGRGRGA